jgi:hypothetical protein
LQCSGHKLGTLYHEILFAFSPPFALVTIRSGM